MSILPQESIDKIGGRYKSAYRIDIRLIDVGGRVTGVAPALENTPPLASARSNALREAVRWGEPYQYFALPNVIDWIMPIVRGGDILCGISGGMVLPEKSAADRLNAINQLAESGGSRRMAADWHDSLPIWHERSQMQQAAEFLFELTFRHIEWDMALLRENREKSVQQRQIAEEIHRRKSSQSRDETFDREQTLLTLVKAGDKKGARGELNRMLGALFSHTADIRLIKAHMIEMMGYLVRTAVENNPCMSQLIEKNHGWMGKIIEAPDFEKLSNDIAEALEDFLDNVYLQSRSGTNETVARILSYLNDNYDQEVTLRMIADHVDLSTFRVAHLVKEVTGNTVRQHIRRLRIQRATELLTKGGTSCTDVAYAVGYCDQSYFIKQFKRQMGTTPSRYRRMHV